MSIAKVIILTIPIHDQRYPTAGDWEFEGNALTIRVSDTGDPRSNMLVALHELVEAVLCNWHGITQSVVDAWDIHGPGAELDEPGDHVAAPYHKEHVLAEIVERLVAQSFPISWKEHEENILTLFAGKRK